MAEFDLGLPPMLKKGARKRVTKKFHSTKNLPIDVAVRRQVAAEIGEDEPTKDEKFVLLQKYGVAAPRIDRLISKPNWMGVAEWKRKLNEWFKATKGLVRPQQRPRFSRPNSNLPQQRSNNQTPGFNPRRLGDPRFPERFNQSYRKPTPLETVETRINRQRDTRAYRGNFGPTRTETLPN